jgi:hypothetical protein
MPSSYQVVLWKQERFLVRHQGCFTISKVLLRKRDDESNNDPSHRATRGLGKLLGLSVVVAGAVWCVGYLYLVKLAGYPAARFFTLKMLAGLVLLSFALSSIFWLRFRSRP